MRKGVHRADCLASRATRSEFAAHGLVLGLGVEASGLEVGGWELAWDLGLGAWGLGLGFGARGDG